MVAFASQVQIVDTPLAMPGSCRYCGGASKKCYLDTGLQFDFEGAVYICDECFGFMADLFGYITPDRANDLKENAKRLTHQVEELEIKNMALQQAINSMKVGGYDERDSVSDSDASDDPVIHPSDPSFVESLQVGENGPDESLPEGTSEEGRDSDGPSEQSDEQRMANLSIPIDGESEPLFEWS